MTSAVVPSGTIYHFVLMVNMVNAEDQPRIKEIIPRWINIRNATSIREPDGQLETKLTNFGQEPF